MPIGQPVTMAIIVVLTIVVLAGVVSDMGPDTLDDTARRGRWPGCAK